MFLEIPGKGLSVLGLKLVYGKAFSRKKAYTGLFRPLGFKAASFSCPLVFGRRAPFDMGCFEIDFEE